MTHYHTTKAAAALVGISVSSLRNYTVTFADFLSADASPPTGTERRLRDQDVAVLQRVVELRAQGMGTEAIKQALQDEDISALVAYVDVVATIEPQLPAEAPPMVPDLATTALAAIRDQQAELIRRIEDVEARATERYQSLVLGILIGIAVTALALGLIWAGMNLR